MFLVEDFGDLTSYLDGFRGLAWFISGFDLEAGAAIDGSVGFLDEKSDYS